jgi:hypothetical protein
MDLIRTQERREEKEGRKTEKWEEVSRKMGGSLPLFFESTGESRTPATENLGALRVGLWFSRVGLERTRVGLWLLRVGLEGTLMDLWLVRVGLAGTLVDLWLVRVGLEETLVDLWLLRIGLEGMRVDLDWTRKPRRSAERHRQLCEPTQHQAFAPAKQLGAPARDRDRGWL